MKKALAALVVAALAGVGIWLAMRKPAADAVEEDWTLEATGPAPTDAMPDAVKALVERIASPDAMEAAVAWLELGARYRSSAAFLAEVKPALWDARPVSFPMVKETFVGKDVTFTYFTAKTPSSKGVPAYVHSVGQSLCYHLWQYEDVSNSGFHGNFKQWWATFAPKHGLPTPK